MSVPIYDASIPVLIRGLGNLSHILDKAEAFARDAGIAPETLTEARLAPDMHELARQIHLASDSAKGCGARLSGVAIPSFPDEERTFDELRARIAKTVAFLEGVDRAAVEGAATRELTIKLGKREVTTTGAAYLFGFVLPNFYFHVATAYGILRNAGVPLTKPDYLGPIG